MFTTDKFGVATLPSDDFDTESSSSLFQDGDHDKKKHPQQLIQLQHNFDPAALRECLLTLADRAVSSAHNTLSLGKEFDGFRSKTDDHITSLQHLTGDLHSSGRATRESQFHINEDIRAIRTRMIDRSHFEQHQTEVSTAISGHRKRITDLEATCHPLTLNNTIEALLNPALRELHQRLDREDDRAKQVEATLTKQVAELQAKLATNEEQHSKHVEQLNKTISELTKRAEESEAKLFKTQEMHRLQLADQLRSEFTAALEFEKVRADNAAVLAAERVAESASVAGKIAELQREAGLAARGLQELGDKFVRSVERAKYASSSNLNSSVNNNDDELNRSDSLRRADNEQKQQQQQQHQEKQEEAQQHKQQQEIINAAVARVFSALANQPEFAAAIVAVQQRNRDDGNNHSAAQSNNNNPARSGNIFSADVDPIFFSSAASQQQRQNQQQQQQQQPQQSSSPSSSQQQQNENNRAVGSVSALSSLPERAQSSSRQQQQLNQQQQAPSSTTPTQQQHQQRTTSASSDRRAMMTTGITSRRPLSAASAAASPSSLSDVLFRMNEERFHGALKNVTPQQSPANSPDRE